MDDELRQRIEERKRELQETWNPERYSMKARLVPVSVTSAAPAPEQKTGKPPIGFDASKEKLAEASRRGGASSKRRAAMTKRVTGTKPASA